MIIKNLDKAVKTIKGADIYIDKDKPLTKEIVLISCCESFQSKVPGESLKIYSIGLKINKKKEVDLSDEEVTLLQKAVEANAIFTSVVIGSMMQELTAK